METDPTRRFSDRVDNYVKYRPHYPKAMLTCLQVECGLTATAVIADVGAGTGILSQLFLHNGNPVRVVEPNPEMRAAAESLLSHYPNFNSVEGTAEATTLPDDSVDFITAGQAFHWFDAAKAKVEFRRILKPGGFVALIWNSRRVEGSSFMCAYEDLVRRHSTDYEKVTHTRKDNQKALASLFDGQMQARVFDNEQRFDFEGLKGRYLSSSYAPMPGHPQHDQAVEKLRQLFDTFAEDGRVRFQYGTRLYFGRVE